MIEHLFNMNNSVDSLLANLIDLCNTEGSPKIRRQTLELFDLLCGVGLDFYSLLSHYSKMDRLSEAELLELLFRSPKAQAVMLPDLTNIRKVIPRWTGTKYHTAPIADVIAEVRRRILLGESGIFCYNSNLNHRNRKSLNDPYVLIVVPKAAYWYDINRKASYQFSLNPGGNEECSK